MRDKELAKLLDEEEKPLIADLKKVGIEVDSVWDLVNTRDTYPEAIEVLIQHLQRPYHWRNKEGIVRALTIKEAKGIACRTIIDEYHKTPKEDTYLRWAFGNAMAIIFAKEYTDEVIEILKDKLNGTSRDMFVRALSKVRSPKTKAVLELLKTDSDEDVKNEALRALKKFK